jgi:predicted Zn-dependent protease
MVSTDETAHTPPSTPSTPPPSPPPAQSSDVQIETAPTPTPAKPKRRRAAKAQKPTPMLTMAEVQILMDEGDFDTALTQLHRMRNADPSNPDILAAYYSPSLLIRITPQRLNTSPAWR